MSALHHDLGLSVWHLGRKPSEVFFVEDFGNGSIGDHGMVAPTLEL
jgi:hypothetical protein